jgi:hypothetical protein
MDNQTAQQEHSSKGNSCCDEVTSRRIYQLKKHYEETAQIPELKRAGRKPKPIDEKTKKIVLQAHKSTDSSQ